MGNCFRRDSADDDLDLSTTDDINLYMNVYLHQKEIQRRRREMSRWCASKLALTEDIIRMNRSRLQQNTSDKNEPTEEDFNREIRQLQEYRKKLIKLMKHPNKLDHNNGSFKRAQIQNKEPHKYGVRIMTALAEAWGSSETIDV